MTNQPRRVVPRASARPQGRKSQVVSIEVTASMIRKGTQKGILPSLTIERRVARRRRGQVRREVQSNRKAIELDSMLAHK